MEAAAPPRTAAQKALDGLEVEHDKAQSGKGAPGSRENPEVLENVPGHVIPVLAEEFEDFRAEAEGFLGGERGEDTFVPFRLKQGVYGQRQADVSASSCPSAGSHRRSWTPSPR